MIRLVIRLNARTSIAFRCRLVTVIAAGSVIMPMIRSRQHAVAVSATRRGDLACAFETMGEGLVHPPQAGQSPAEHRQKQQGKQETVAANHGSRTL